jgi:putative peptidoglycan lipid II flippase
MSSEHFVRHARTFAGLTLISRVLGLARDAVIVRTLGVSGLQTAFNIAFQLPNTFRRLFGEGALSAAFIPEYAQTLKRDPELSHRFASLTIAIMSIALGALVLILELILLAVLALATLSDNGRIALILLMIMLPYMPLICITAALGGMLQTHARFAAQAGAPIILNLCMIAAALGTGWILKLPATSTAIAVAISVTIAGFLQTAWCLRDLRGIITWSRAFHGASHSVRRMFRKMGPLVLGLGTQQIATLIESWVILAWPLYFGATIFGIAYPLDETAGAALVAAQRLYQFPLGIFGIALATAAFPLLAKQADEPDKFAATLRRGIRLALFIGVPATLGMIWVARDLTAVIFMGGKVTPADAMRMASCLIAYAALVGTYSVTHVITRAFYAKSDTRTPTIISIITVILGLALGFALMFKWHEQGLAYGSSLAAAVQLAMLLILAQKRLGPTSGSLIDRATALAIVRITIAAAAMLTILFALDQLWPAEEIMTWRNHLIRLIIACSTGAAAYTAAAFFLCREEIRWSTERHPK